MIYADGNQRWNAQTSLQVARMDQLQGIIDKFAKDNSVANLIVTRDLGTRWVDWAIRTKPISFAQFSRLRARLRERLQKQLQSCAFPPSSDSWENTEYDLVECWQWSARRVLPIVREMHEAVAEVEGGI